CGGLDGGCAEAACCCDGAGGVAVAAAATCLLCGGSFAAGCLSAVAGLGAGACNGAAAACDAAAVFVAADGAGPACCGSPSTQRFNSSLAVSRIAVALLTWSGVELIVRNSVASLSSASFAFASSCTQRAAAC